MLARFVALAGGPDAAIIYIPSAASGIRLPSGFIAELPESREITPSKDALESALVRLFRVRQVRILHTRNRAVAASESLAEPLRAARAVGIGCGNAGRLASLYLDTPLRRALADVLARSSVTGGNSAQSSKARSSFAGGRTSRC